MCISASLALSANQLARYTQIDYDREMAFIATTCVQGERSETLGVVRAVADPDGRVAEFAIIVRSDWHGRGLGARLMDKLVRYCRAQGMEHIVGHILRENQRMLRLAKHFGFKATHLPTDGVVKVSLTLDSGV